VKAPPTRSQARQPRVNTPNYISQDEDDVPPTIRRTTRSTTTSIMQEAMVSCVDIYKPQYVLSKNLGILNFAATVPTGKTCTVTPQQMSVCRIPMLLLCEMANSVIGDNGELLEYRHLVSNPKTRSTWTHSYGNEVGRLAQGMPGLNTGTNTIFFIQKDQVPRDRAKDVTYGLITTLIRSEKIEEPNRTRLVAGGDRVHYLGDAGTPTADLLTVKLLLNSIISTPNAKFMTMDIKDFYLNTPMARYEYMRLRLSDMPEYVIAHYKLNEIATPEGYIYCEIQKGMYGLPQAGIISQQLLEERLQKDGYRSKTTPGLWTRDTHPISFSLVVDDFGVKYVGEENAKHLLDTVREYYKCSCDWEGERYCGLTIKWDYAGQKVHLSMPGYVHKALTRFQHPPRQNDRTSHTPTPNQIMERKSNTHKKKMTHQPSARRGKILSKRYVACSCSSRGRSTGGLLPTLSSLASQQANPTERTMELCKKFLDFMSCQEDRAQIPQPRRRPHVHGGKRQKSPSTTGQSSTSLK
jgi:hypothetical protein